MTSCDAPRSVANLTGSTFHLPIGPLLLKRKLGSGSFGAVYEVEIQQHRFACKAMPLCTPQEYNDYSDERLVLSQVQLKPHKNLVTYLGHDHPNETDRIGFFFFEIASLRTLNEYRVREGENGALDMKSALKIYAQLTEALALLHSLGIYHRDVKPANILMKAKNHPQLTDFGLAVLDSRTSAPIFTNAVGSLAYAAPEVLVGSPKFKGDQADLWAASTTLVESVLGNLPWTKATEESARFSRFVALERATKSTWPQFDNLPAVYELLHPDPKVRQFPASYGHALKKYRRS